jgi:hypothetical protein
MLGRVLVKFIGTQAEHDRVDPENRVMAKKMIRPIRTETEYDEALEEVERYFEKRTETGHAGSGSLRGWPGSCTASGRFRQKR